MQISLLRENVCGKREVRPNLGKNEKLDIVQKIILPWGKVRLF
jgi:hypothetical protein